MNSRDSRLSTEGVGSHRAPEGSRRATFFPQPPWEARDTGHSMAQERTSKESLRRPESESQVNYAVPRADQGATQHTNQRGADSVLRKPGQARTHCKLVSAGEYSSNALREWASWKGAHPSPSTCALPKDPPAAVQPPDGRFLGDADVDELRQAVLPVQEVGVL